ncbi:MAG: hypothetical protein HQL07_00910 [Nitrospirae bacterium]|nr:hypothetical protein [Magnetococcales bacterium]HAT48761.1 hypothetical protein [Alphaproteobacteria bacterium]
MPMDDDEGLEDDREGSSQESAQDQKNRRKRKMVLIVIVTLVLEFVAFGVYQVFFKTEAVDKNEAKKKMEQLKEEKKLARKIVVRGHWFAERIPALPPLAYQSKYVSKGGASGVGKNTASGGKTGGGEKAVSSHPPAQGADDEDVERTAKGDVVYSEGEKKWLGAEGKDAGTVVVDRLQVVTDDFGGRTARGRIVNYGRQSLSRVTALLDFTQPDGGVVISRKINPLVISGGLFGDRIQTLQPGDSRIFQVDASDLPASWKGQVAVLVQSYHFVP